MKTFGKFFLGLAVIFVLIQPLSAEDLNTPSDYSGIQTISPAQVTTNLTFDDTVRTAREIVAVSSGQSIPSSQSSANTSSQNPLSVLDYPSIVTETASTRLEPYSVTTDPVTNREFVNGQVIVRFKSQNNGGPSISNEKIRMAHAKVGAKVKKDFSADGIVGLQVVRLPNGTDVQSAIKEYQSNPDVLYAEPDYVVSIIPDQTGPIVQDTNPAHILAIPSDGFFSELWGLHNTGQTGGTPDADIDAPEAWDISTGSSSVVVAVIDTGVLYTHSDLSSNIWNNTGEIPGNGIDDDDNGYIDDVRGWDFVNTDNDPVDDQKHGTHVSGTIGAVGNNAIGVAGVNWQVKIMPLKAFNFEGSGSTSDAIEAIKYANANGASVISNSWGGGDYSDSLKDAIDESNALVICAAGNGGQDNIGDDNDATPIYPASYSSPNIIAVAATDHNDALASFSNFGLSSVDLAAPGKVILSTYLDGSYIYMSGTSMATPHVSGVAALVKAVNQSLSSAEIKTIILSTVDAKSSLSGKVATGGRLNAYNAILATPPAVPVADFSGVPTSGTAPLPVSFTDLSLNNPIGWAWYFGDETYMAPWTEMNASAGWSGRYGHSSVVMPDGSIVLMGGYGGGIKNDVWRSPNNGATWTQVNASAGWAGRYGHNSVVMPDGSIILTGGFGIGGYKNDTWRSTDNGATWTQVNASSGWSAREYHSSVAMPDGSIVLMGGTDNYTYSYLNDVWRSTDNGALWIQVNASAGWTKRWDHKSVAMPDGSIVLIGGVDGSAYKNDSWRFKPAGSSAQNPSHTYTAPGTYRVALQAYNSVGYNSSRKTGYITVTELQAPVADFAGTPREGTAPLTVVFTDLSTGGPTSWTWSFGDGNTMNSTVQNPVHTFLTSGNYTVSLTVANTLEGNTTTRIGYINVTNATHQIGIFRPSAHTFYLKNGTTTTATDWGISTDLPVTGDWNGDGRTDVGVYRPSAHTFYLKNGSALSWTTTAINWGTSTDLPVTGDWNGDGITEVGVYRPSAHTFYLKNGSALSWTTTATDWGISTDLPVTGDWNGDGRTDVGVYRPSAHTFYLKNGTALSWTTTATDWGISIDLPVTGDWNGNSITDVGVYRPSAHMFYLKNGTALSWTTTAINWGTSTDLPVTGKW